MPWPASRRARRLRMSRPTPSPASVGTQVPAVVVRSLLSALCISFCDITRAASRNARGAEALKPWLVRRLPEPPSGKMTPDQGGIHVHSGRDNRQRRNQAEGHGAGPGPAGALRAWLARTLVLLAPPDGGYLDTRLSGCGHDVRGYGGSSKPWEIEAYTLREICGDVAAVARARSVEPVVLAGHDWGAPIVYATALLHPDRCAPLLASACLCAAE